MNKLAQTLYHLMTRLLIVICLLGVGWGIVVNFEWVFSKVVVGEVIEVERFQPPAVIGATMTPEQMFSVAVMIRAESGEIFSSSSEDRQWAVAKKGYCVEARFYPYPPWNLDKADTYHNARLIKVLADCKRLNPPVPSVNAPSPTPPPAPPLPPAGASPSASPSATPSSGAH
jgi:hypothetical protein